MKKLFLVLAMLSTVSVLAFAGNFNTELDISYTYLDRNIQTSKGDLFENSPIGLNVNSVFYYCSPNQYVDLGFAANFGLDAFNTVNGLNCSGMDLSAGFAPAFRFNFGQFTSFYVTPGFVFDNMNINMASKVNLSSLSFEFDAGYRGWFITNTNYSMGVCAGYKIGVPFCGNGTVYSGGSSENFNVFGNSSQKIYLGLCMNFGIKSDAKRATFRKVN